MKTQFTADEINELISEGEISRSVFDSQLFHNGEYWEIVYKRMNGEISWEEFDRIDNEDRFNSPLRRIDKVEDILFKLSLLLKGGEVTSPTINTIH